MRESLEHRSSIVPSPSRGRENDVELALHAACVRT